MQHKASGPLLGLWPGRALVTLVATLCLGIGGYLTIAAVTGGGTPEAPPDAAAPPVSEEGNSPDPTSTPPEGRTTEESPSESDASESSRPHAPAPSDVTEPPAPDQDTDSPTTPSTNPSPTRTREPRDVTPPNTSMSEAQPAPDAARFTFSSNEGASFACSLDGAAFTPCDSPSVYSDLQPGWHTFTVKAVDAAGNTDPSPAESRWHAENGHAAGP